MDKKPTLPIEKMTLEEFQEFRVSSLDGIVMDSEVIESIKHLFGVGDPSTGSINCDEYHAHEYECVSYKHPITGVVDKLIRELNSYRRKLDSINADSKIV